MMSTQLYNHLCARIIPYSYIEQNTLKKLMRDTFQPLWRSLFTLFYQTPPPSLSPFLPTPQSRVLGHLRLKEFYYLH